MAAEVEGGLSHQTHEQLRRKTVHHRVAGKGKRDGVGCVEEEEEDVDTGSAKDVAIDFVGGVVSGISGIVVGQVRRRIDCLC